MSQKNPWLVPIACPAGIHRTYLDRATSLGFVFAVAVVAGAGAGGGAKISVVFPSAVV